MSKRSKEKKPLVADWEVSTYAGEDMPPTVEIIVQARWKRTKPGWYTFRDAGGVVTEFTPGTVLKVTRAATLHPDPYAMAAGAARTELAAKRGNGGPEIRPVKPHGGKP